jgi:LacI family transcriptional regulator
VAKERVTIRDVAARAGVSVATASKAINDRYGVAAATVRRVHEVVAELGYESSLVARSMRIPRTGVIGILVWEIEPYSAEVLKGAARAVREADHELLVYAAAGRAADRMGWELRYLPRLSGTLIDGAVLVTPTVESTPGSMPVVAVDSRIGGAGLPAVDSDNLAGARLATDHLLGLGHRRIGFLGRPPRDLESAHQREQGYRASLAAAGVPFDPDLVRAGGYGAISTARSWSRPTRRRRSSRRTTCPRSPPSTSRSRSAWTCRAMSRWSASTTSRRARCAGPR